MTKTALVLAEINSRLAREVLRADMRVRNVGKAPTQHTAPLLFELWACARDQLLKSRGGRAPEKLFFKCLRLQVASIWANPGHLDTFFVRDYYTGELLLTGNVHGPLFPVTHNSPTPGGKWPCGGQTILSMPAFQQATQHVAIGAASS